MEQLHPSFKDMQDEMFSSLKDCEVCQSNDWILKCACCSHSKRLCCMGGLLLQVNDQRLDLATPWTNFCNICVHFKHHDKDRSMWYISKICERRPSDRYIRARKRERRRLKEVIRKYNKIVGPAINDRVRTYLSCERTNKRSWAAQYESDAE